MALVTRVENRFPRRGSCRVEKDDGRSPYIVTIARVKGRRGEEAFLRIIEQLTGPKGRYFTKWETKKLRSLCLAWYSVCIAKNREIFPPWHMHASAAGIPFFSAEISLFLAWWKKFSRGGRMINKWIIDKSADSRNTLIVPRLGSSQFFWCNVKTLLVNFA